jgi:hypothetical protein
MDNGSGRVEERHFVIMAVAYSSGVILSYRSSPFVVAGFGRGGKVVELLANEPIAEFAEYSC